MRNIARYCQQGHSGQVARVLHGSSPAAAFSFLGGNGADRTGRSRMAFARYKREETLIHSFVNTGGKSPRGLTGSGEVLYGTTYAGGVFQTGVCSIGCGTVFELKR
jgi:hypothetical protein